MSRFKVGDRVRRGSTNEEREVCVIDGADCTFYDEASGKWYFEFEFELLAPPQPVESPDDWVTQDVEAPRNGIDHWCWIRLGKAPISDDWRNDNGYFDRYRHGDINQSGHLQLHVRCRRRDYPQKPAEVHTGGPLVARSEYERVCLERDELRESLSIADNSNSRYSSVLSLARADAANANKQRDDAVAQAARIRDEAVKLAQARDKAIYDLNAVRATLEKRDAEVANLRHEQSVLLADLKNFEETTTALNKRVLGGNPNGWPLVPVDPSCIPDGHRAVEVTCATAGKLVASSDGNARHFNGTHIVPRLVVEPIPTPQSPDALPRPEFPVWIRAGWWVAMDPDSVFWVFEYEPKVDEQCGEYTSRGECVLLSDDQLTPSMRAVPVDRWRKAKWQIE